VVQTATIVDSEVRDEEFTVFGEVALNEVFGFWNHLSRRSTQGKSEFVTAFKHHMTVPPKVQKELGDEYRKALFAAEMRTWCWTDFLELLLEDIDASLFEQ